MKKALITFTLCVPLLFGCVKNEGRTPPETTGAKAEAKNTDESPTPYYYGLIEELRTLLAEDPSNLAVIIALGNAYYDSGQWETAINMYEQALLIDPRNADVRADMATAFRNMGKPDQALAEYRTVIKYDAGHLNARFNLGIVYAYDKKDYRTAIKVWKELLKLAPNHPRAAYLRATIESFKKELEKDRK